MKSYIFISWLAQKEDPYLHDRAGNVLKAKDGNPIPGPIHGVVLDEHSPYIGKIEKGFVLSIRSPREKLPSEDVRRRFRALSALIETSDSPFPVKLETCATEDPTDHRTLFSFCLDILGKARSEYPGVHFVINTSSGTPAMHTVWVLLSETGQIEGDYTLVQGIPPEKRSKRKPTSVSEVRIGLDSAFGRYREVKVALSSYVSDGSIDLSRAKSPLLRKLYADAKLYAGANIPILILGERGTGKTEIAKFIRGAFHAARSTKASNHWPIVNCGQFKGDPDLMRSELFGHTKGAFTGAINARDGILKKVDKDVLFLDEIADLDRTSQRLLIRAIEEKTYTPSGDGKALKSDFKLVSATNRPLTDLRGEGLDPDFFDRISTLRLRMPSLRETPEDLDWMWDKMLVTTARRAGIAHVDLSEGERTSIVKRLRQELLPGNYRDLIRLASHVLLFIGSGSHFSSRKKALEAAFELAFESPVIKSHDPNRELSRRYVENETIKDLLQKGISVPGAISSYKAFIGTEITKHLSKEEVKKKTGVSYESANQWKKIKV